MTLLACLVLPTAVAADVRIKDLVRIDGVRENAVVGYGIVVGLAGTGDSARSRATVQSVMNTLSAFDISVSVDDISSRNVAAVSLTATLPAFAEPGDRIDVQVSSLGDARSLLGGTLMLAPLKTSDDRIYVLAQGPVSIGAYQYSYNGNVVQKNHPTVGIVTAGGTIERSLRARVLDASNRFALVLNSPDYTTASRIQTAINRSLGDSLAVAEHAGRVVVTVPESEHDDVVAFITRIENQRIAPDTPARVVVNERTGVIVAGGDVRIDAVTVSHGGLRVTIDTQYTASQPAWVRNADNVATVVVPNTDVQVDEKRLSSLQVGPDATIWDLVEALRQIHVSTQDAISILQAIKKAGALHAELVIQ